MKKKQKSISRQLYDSLSYMIKSEMSLNNDDSYRYIPNPDDEKRYYCPRPEDKHNPWKKKEDKYTPWINPSEDIPGTEITKKPAGEFDDLTLDQLKKEEKKAVGTEDYEKAARIRDEIQKRQLNEAIQIVKKNKI
jgi:hypothetical protein